MRRHELQMRSSGSFIRCLKRETDLPPKFRTPIEVPMKLSKEQQELAQINSEIETILAESLRRGD